MRWVVAFNGARDGYQVPLALAEADALESLVTDWYSPLDVRAIQRVVSALPASVGRALARRYVVGLPSARVRSRPLETLRQLLRLGTLDASDARLGAHAGRLARERGAGILAYHYYAESAFRTFGEGRGPRALFQVQAHPASFRRILTEEMRRLPEASASLNREPELAGTAERIHELSRVPHAADVCLVPSTYARATLLDAGVEPSRVHVAPYGVDLEAFRPRPSSPDGPFRALFVGQLTYRKGLHYLLEAWRRLALPDAELTLVGRGVVDDALLARYAGTYRLEMNVRSRPRLRELYASSDLFCMPSLVESFGLVYLEALACGTPILGTPDTGAIDLIDEGVEGFIVAPRDVAALEARLAWCYDHRESVAAMRAPARARAERFSWGAFRARVREILARAAIRR